MFVVSSVCVCGQISRFSSFSTRNDKTVITVSLPGGEDAEHYKCSLGGDLRPLCRFIQNYARTVAAVGDEFLVVYPQVRNM